MSALTIALFFQIRPGFASKILLAFSTLSTIFLASAFNTSNIAICSNIAPNVAKKQPIQNRVSGKMRNKIVTDSASLSNVNPDQRQVLASERFIGQAALGYAAAKLAPEICAKLFCYCGCDYTDSHTNLLDCFTSLHGVDCHICQQEAIEALNLKKEGKSIGEIQKHIDNQYAKEYVFNVSPALDKYKSTRLYTQTPDPLPDGKSTGLSPGGHLPNKKVNSNGCCGSEHR